MQAQVLCNAENLLVFGDVDHVVLVCLDQSFCVVIWFLKDDYSRGPK